MGRVVLPVIVIILMVTAAFALNGMETPREGRSTDISHGPTTEAPGPSDGGGRGGFVDDMNPEAFPAVFLPHNASTHMVDAFYPNEDHTGYLDAQPVQSGPSSGATFADLDGDGHMDFVCGNDECDSQIYWGNGSGTWSNENTTNLSTESYTHAQTGDFNGDGELDIVFSGNATIFLNQGKGRFNYLPDINLPSEKPGDQTIGDPPGDLNGDGYDDVLVVDRWDTGNKVRCYFGGPDGPDTVPDIEYPMGERGRAYLEDIDDDGHLDIVLGANLDGSQYVYLGSEDGPDNSSDCELTVPGHSQRVSVGDVNGDGYPELAFTYYESASVVGIRVFKGNESGWSNDSWYDISPSYRDVIALELMDVNLDGYEDILAVVRMESFLVYLGGDTWPTEPDIEKSTEATPFQMAIAATSRVSLNRTRPSPPTDLTATGGDGSVLLEWDRPEDTGGVQLLRYNVYRGPSEGSLVLRDSVGFDALGYNDTSCVNGRTYHYAVTAVNFKGESDRSNVANATPLGRPRAPENLTATPGCGTVLLEWDPPSDTGGLPILGYRLHRGTTSVDIEHLTNLSDVTRYRDDTVENGRTYLYMLCAWNSLGDGPFTSVLSTMPLGPPDAPWGLQVVEGDANVTLSWRPPLRDGGRPVMGYFIFREPAEGLFEEPLPVGASPTGYVDLDVTNGATYRYKVRAWSTLGNSTWSDLISATPHGFPGSPRNLTALAGDGHVTLGWEDPEDDGGAPIEGFIVYMGLVERSFESLEQVQGTNYTVIDLPNGEVRYFKVSARNRRGEGPSTEVVRATPMARPGAPVDLAVEARIGSLVLRWEPPRDTGGMPVISYIIYRGTDPASLVYLNHTEPIPRIYLDDRVEDHTTYYYSVSAITEAGEGPRAGAVSGMPQGPPSAPIGLILTAGDGRVDMSWSTPASDGGMEIGGYVILRGLTRNDLEVVERDIDVPSYTDLDVENGTEYYYAVRAYNGGGEGPLSDIVRARPERVPVVPGAPRDLRAEVDGVDVTLTWERPVDDGGLPILGYGVFRGTSPEDLQPHADPGLVLSFEDTGLARGPTYYYRVVAENDVGPGRMSEVVAVRIAEAEEPGEPGRIPVLWLILIAIGAVSLVVSGGASRSEPFRYRGGLLMAPLFSRLSRDDVLDNRTRMAVHGTIVENPGIHYSEILREFDLTNGVAAYHLNVLVREGFVRSVNDGNLKRFYAKHTKVPRVHKMTPEEVRSEILTIVTTNPGISQKDIVDELGRDRATVGYHLREMVREGRLGASRKGQYTVYHRKRGRRS